VSEGVGVRESEATQRPRSLARRNTSQLMTRQCGALDFQTRIPRRTSAQLYKHTRSPEHNQRALYSGNVLTHLWMGEEEIGPACMPGAQWPTHACGSRSPTHSLLHIHTHAGSLARGPCHGGTCDGLTHAGEAAMWESGRHQQGCRLLSNPSPSALVLLGWCSSA
jgi:hypothetical protein